MGGGSKFLWADTGSVRVMMHDEQAPSDADWDRFLASTVRHVNGELVASERRGAMIYSRGGMATPRQRAKLKALSLKGASPTLVLLTDSRMARGVATALGWLLPALRHFHAFSLSQLDDAVRLLCSHEAERRELRAVIDRLLRELDGDDVVSPARESA